MRQAATGALLVLALFATASGPWLAASASTLAAVYGIGGAALADNSQVLSSNPALLGRLDVLRLSTGLRTQSQLQQLQGEWILPTSNGPNWGLGLQQQRDPSTDSFTRQQMQAGLGQALSPRWSLGAGLDLWSDNGARDFAAHAGVHFVTSPSAHSQVNLAVVARNLIEPTQAAVNTPGTRGVDLAAALRHSLSPVWTLTSSAGLRSGKDLRRSASVAAVLRWKERLECGVGWQESMPRLALGWRNNAWSLGWSLALESAVHTQEVGVSWSWGPSLPQRRAALRQQQTNDTNEQIEAAVSSFEARQHEQWKRFAEESFANGELDRAASFFGMVLTTNPADADAQAGFKRSRHAMFVAEADSLMQRSNYGGAARALEEALHVSPADSSSAVRLREVRRASRLAFRQQTDAEQLFRQGIDAFAQQNYLEAIRSFRGVLALDPEHHMASSYLSQADQSHRIAIDNTLTSATKRLEAKEFDAARRLVRRLLANEPDQPRALQLLVSIDTAEKDIRARLRDEQEEELRRAEARKAQLTAAVSPAPAAVEDAAPAAPSEEIIARYEEGIRLYRTSDMTAAMKAWEEVAAQAPHYQDVDSYLLRVYRVAGLERYTEGRLQEAVDIWEKALQLDPQNRQLARYLSQAQAKLKRVKSSGADG